MQVTRIGIKEGRTPCCGRGCCQRDSAEHEGYDGAPTNTRITENNTTNADRVIQGGSISPLCSNIMLNELDHELESRGIRFVRYADDMLLFAKTKRSAQRMQEHILPFIEKKLLLKVNKEKTMVANIGKVKWE